MSTSEKYVLYWKDLLGMDAYVRVVDGSTYNLILDPNYADTFTTKKSAIDWLEKNIDHINVWKESDFEVIKLKEAQEKFKEFSEGGCVFQTRHLLDNNTFVEYDPDKHTLEDICQFYINHSKRDDECSYKIYSSWPDLHQVSEHIFGTNGYHDIEDYNHILVYPEIYVGKDSDFNVFKKEFDRVLPLFDTEEGDYIVDVFDRFLSAHGDCVSLIGNDDEWYVEGFDELGDANNRRILEQCFNFLCRFRYYPEDDEEDV